MPRSPRSKRFLFSGRCSPSHRVIGGRGEVRIRGGVGFDPHPLGDGGIFNAMAMVGALDHQVEGLDVEGAITEPPQDTRAKIRGAVVRRLSNVRFPYGAEWTTVYDDHRCLVLDLRDPFETEERWSAASELERRLHPESAASSRART